MKWVGLGPSKSQLGKHFRRCLDKRLSPWTCLSSPGSLSWDCPASRCHLHTQKRPSISICTHTKSPSISICTHTKCPFISIFAHTKYPSISNCTHTQISFYQRVMSICTKDTKVFLSARCHLHTHSNVRLSARCVCAQAVYNSLL